MDSFERWAVVVIRANGTDRELLSDLYETEAAAIDYSRVFLGWCQMITVEVVPVSVPAAGIPVKLDAEKFNERFKPAKNETMQLLFPQGA
jgi:hypothetical protein